LFQLHLQALIQNQKGGIAMKDDENYKAGFVATVLILMFLFTVSVFVQPAISGSEKGNFIQNFDQDQDGKVSKEESKILTKIRMGRYQRKSSVALIRALIDSTGTTTDLSMRQKPLKVLHLEGKKVLLHHKGKKAHLRPREPRVAALSKILTKIRMGRYQRKSSVALIRA
jgi:hypothetical protein